MLLKKIILSITVFVVTISLLSAQEVLYDLSSNPVLQKLNKNYNDSKLKSLENSKSIELPFKDDFSGNSAIPDTSRWIDANVFINSNYAINPPSIGVATFDALDAGGNVYANATIDPFLADQLTSKEINLDSTINSDIFFSFYYQPQGMGNEPESNDSLTLEFNVPGTVNWNSVWRAYGTANQDFEYVIFEIDTLYQKDGFKFRFRNYASLGIESSPGMNANADHWHIDYIIIDKNRSEEDTVLRDITFLYPIESIIPQYESMPWDHYFGATFTETPSMNLRFVSRDTLKRKAVCTFTFEDLMGDSPHFSDTVINTNIEYNQYIDANYKTIQVPELDFFDYQPNGKDSGLFEIKSYLLIDEAFDEDFNDSLTYHQVFSNYYSYDDGTPENGYGVLSSNAKIAYQFEAKKEDALEAIQIYFNPTLDSYTAAPGIFFFLTVWDDNDGEPGDTLYQQIGTKVELSDSLDGYYEYKLTHEILVSGRFYVGLEQTTDDMINIGFDVNRDARNKLFYNISGLWNKTQFEGALMIRPVFGEPDPPKAFENKSKQVNIKPVPANNTIYLGIDGKLIDPGSTVNIYNQYGQLIISATQISYSLDISNLYPGIYIIKIISNSGEIATGRFIVVN